MTTAWIDVVADVLFLRLEQYPKLTLVGIARHANAQGRSRPGRRLLAHYVGVSPRTIQRLTQELHTERWVLDMVTGRGSGNPTEYLLNLDRIEAVAFDQRQALRDAYQSYDLHVPEKGQTQARIDPLAAEKRGNARNELIHLPESHVREKGQTQEQSDPLKGAEKGQTQARIESELKNIHSDRLGDRRGSLSDPDPEPDPVAAALWTAALAELAAQVSRSNYNTWLAATAGLRITGGSIVVGVSSAFALSWLRQHLTPLVLKSLAKVAGGQPIGVTFVVASATAYARDGP